MRELNKNILDVKRGIIVHQVNCMGKMGAGVAIAIRNKYPVVYSEYLDKNWKLGDIQIVNVAPNLWVCNLAGQYRYGRDKRYTDYEAVSKGLLELKEFCDLNSVYRIYFPYKIGCSNAGGDWDIYRSIIEKYFPNGALCKFGKYS